MTVMTHLCFGWMFQSGFEKKKVEKEETATATESITMANGL